MANRLALVSMIIEDRIREMLEGRAKMMKCLEKVEEEKRKLEEEVKKMKEAEKKMTVGREPNEREIDNEKLVRLTAKPNGCFKEVVDGKIMEYKEDEGMVGENDV
ncbi:hypothetical protein VNO78_22363 [Psophocarpus tetragonolobus]|uniref:Uncharacterized protein n=1 Tax=Psophocarpus tetragonolobus TaxID=3891 RepID=A0AAN9SCK4_PSOTE